MNKIYLKNTLKFCYPTLPKKNIILLYLNISNISYYTVYNEFVYIQYIQYNIFKNYYSKYNFKYSSLKKSINIYNLTHKSYPNIKIKNILHNKFIFIETKVNKYNTDYIPSSILIPNIHKQFINLTKLYYKYNLNINNIYSIKLECNLNKINKYYKTWGTNLYVYKQTILKGFYSQTNRKKTYITVKDITTGLSSIEDIFENRHTSNLFILPPTISILNKTFYTYEETSLSYLQIYSLFNIQNKYLIYLNNINKTPYTLYEKISSILLPQHNLISINLSINILISKLYSVYLDFYTQEHASYLSHIYIYNLIVESLTKQYYKNNILIPSIQFEIIAKKMTSFVKLNFIGESSFNEKDIIKFNLINILNITYNLFGYSQLLYTPIVLGISKSILASSGFLVSISFQEILKNIINLSVCSSVDWLTDLKSSIITSNFIKTGSGWYRHFSYI